MVERIRGGVPTPEQAAGIAFGYVCAVQEFSPASVRGMTQEDLDWFVAEYARLFDQGVPVQGAWSTFARRGSLFGSARW
jgi:hypothetical protein